VGLDSPVANDRRPRPARSAPQFDNAFWRSFVAEHWQKKAGVIRSGVPVLDGRDCFQALARAADDVGRLGRPQSIRVFVDGAQPKVSEQRDFFPRAEDGTFDGWRDRLRPFLRGRSINLIGNNVQIYGFEVFRQLREFLTPLFEVIGISPYLVEAAAFVGDYDSTAFGVHQDYIAGLMFVLEGKKSMRLWPEPALTPEEARRHQWDYEAIADRGTRATAEPGDLIYWPAKYWHVGECDGFSVTINVGVGVCGGTFTNPFPEATPSRFIAKAVDMFVGADLGAKNAPAFLPYARGRVGALARTPLPGTQRGLAKLRRALGTDAFKKELVRARLEHMTAIGFKPAPVPREGIVLNEGDEIVVSDRASPIVTVPVGGHLVLAANGHSCIAKRTALLTRIVKQLNSGARCRIPTGRGAKELMPLFDRLYRIRAIDVAPVTKAG
jgi:hypothetical protein